MKKISAAILLVILSLSSGKSQPQFGIDIGQPINVVTGDLNPGTDTALLGSLCTPWVRLNFILGPWTSPADQTLHSGRTWQQAYNEIINKLTAKGIQIYGLIGAEAYTYPADTLEQFPGPDSSAAVSWINNYTYNFVQIVDMFKDRIQFFESFNEPNNWTNSNTAIVHPAWMALMQQEIYLNTKYFNGHAGDPAWQVTMISGALFTFDLNSGSQYIADEYWYGKNMFAWDWTYATYGTYPLDGFGQHLYVIQGDSDYTAISNALNYNISGFRTGVYQYETDPNKKTYISEFGWESNTYGESFQASNLTSSFAAMQNNTDVGLALWFSLSDFPGGEWGLYHFMDFSSTGEKQSLQSFRNFFNCQPVTTGINSAAENEFRLFYSDQSCFLYCGADAGAIIRIIDLAGRTVKEFSAELIAGALFQIELNGIASGNYILSLNTGTANKQFKIAVVN